MPITVSTLLIMANRLNPGKKHRGCCFGCGITMLAVFIGSWALPILAKMKSDRAIEKLRALSAVQADDSDMEFVTEGDKLELQMPEQYGKMYYSQPSPAHFTVAETGEAYVDNEIIAVAESGTSRSVIDSLAEQIGAEIVGEITIADTYQMRLQRTVSYEEIDALCQKLCENPTVADAYPDWLNFTDSDDVSAYQEGVGGFYYGAKVSGDAAANSTDAMDYPEYDVRGITWDKEMINCYRAWKYVQEVPVTPVKVGLVDSHFDHVHESLHFARILPSPDAGDAGDTHGTHVAGIIAANSKCGISGVYPYGSQGYLYGYTTERPEYDENEDWHMFSSNIGWMMSVSTLVVQGVKVINISQGLGWNSNEPGSYERIRKRLKEMGLSVPSEATESIRKIFCDISFFEPWEREAKKVGAFYQRLLDAGYDFVLVSSAGNLGSGGKYKEEGDLKMLDYPRPYGMPYESRYNSTINMIAEEDYPEVFRRIVVVGAVEPRPGTPKEHGAVPMLAGYSNAGIRVDLFAPGGKAIDYDYDHTTFQQAANGTMIYSTFPRNNYEYESGTSMAAPQVTGTAALVWSVNRDLTGAQVKQILCETAKPGCIYTSNQYGTDGGIGIISDSDNYRLLDVEQAVRTAYEVYGSGRDKDPENGAFAGSVQWEEEKDDQDHEKPVKDNEYFSIVAVRTDGIHTGDRYMVQANDRSAFCIPVPPGEYYIKYGIEKNGYKGKQTGRMKVKAHQTVDCGILTVCEDDDASDIIAYQDVLKDDAPPAQTGPEIHTDHLAEFMLAVGIPLPPKAWMRYNGHTYAIYDFPTSGNTRWWRVLFSQNPYPVAVETFEEQGALEQLLAYGEKTAYITGGQVFSIDETDLYWAIEDEDTGFTYFAEGHGCTNDHLCGDFVDLYRGSGTDDPEFGLWKVHHETFSSFFPLGYLKDYGYILEWNTETG